MHSEIKCACRAILKIAFSEISITANSIKGTMETDAGPLAGSPSSIAGPLLSLSSLARSFYLTKIRFRYADCPPEIMGLVDELQAAFRDLDQIAQSIDAVEKRRGSITRFLEFVTGVEEIDWNDEGNWQRVPDVVPDGITRLQELIVRTSAATRTLEHLDSKYPLINS